MRFHALACDYDGTLAHHGTVPPATIEALEAVRASGRRLLLVTGRELDDLRRVFDRLDLFDRVVAENGGLLFRPESLEERLLTEPADERLVARLREHGVAPLSVGRAIVATWEPNDVPVLEAIRELGLELRITFNKGAVMVLPADVSKATGLLAALAELGLSPHNTIGVGDAENDHAFLAQCELAAAVANALPALKDRADIVLDRPRGEGVADLAAMLLDDRLAAVERGLERLRVPFGEADGRPVGPAGHRDRVLVAGPSGSGKSTLVWAFLEGLTDRGYQVCLVDPEGDYEHLPGAVLLGTADRPPSIDEVRAALDDPGRPLVVNLLGLALDERPGFFQPVGLAIQELRARTGRPHWLVVDEAHHLLPPSWHPERPMVPEALGGLLLVTVHPDRLAPTILEHLDLVVAVGDDRASTLAAAAGDARPTVPARPADAAAGDALLWRRDAGPGAVTRFTPAAPRQAAQRHRRKYATGDLGEDLSFVFRGPEGRLALRAQNLVLFLQMGDGVDDETWLHHLRQGDYSRWMRDVIKDEGLADDVAAEEQRPDPDAAATRRRIREAVESRYTAPA